MDVEFLLMSQFKTYFFLGSGPSIVSIGGVHNYESLTEGWWTCVVLVRC